jgi:hypothetical protein
MSKKILLGCKAIPTRIHNFLLEGMKDWTVWTWDNVRPAKGLIWNNCGSLLDALYDAAEGKTSFKWNEELLDDLSHRTEAAIHVLDLWGSPEEISQRFVTEGFAEAYIKRNKANRGRKNKRNGK